MISIRIKNPTQAGAELPKALTSKYYASLREASLKISLQRYARILKSVTEGQAAGQTEGRSHTWGQDPLHSPKKVGKI